jgi:hypothetical protein
MTDCIHRLEKACELLERAECLLIFNQNTWAEEQSQLSKEITAFLEKEVPT